MFDDVTSHFAKLMMSSSIAISAESFEVSLGSYTTLAKFGFSPSPDILTTVIVLGHQQLK
jgi:hypothetical protein